MIVGIVGHEAKKFTSETEARAREVIRALVAASTGVSSGRSPLGGIDVWAEEEADRQGVPKYIYPPARETWSNGYRERNLMIAWKSDIVYCLVVKEYPPDYDGMRFSFCYHCHARDHIKSGGCWTAWRARQRKWILI